MSRSCAAAVSVSGLRAALLVAFAVVSRGQGERAERLLHAELEVGGPLTSVRMRTDAGLTSVDGRIRDGERRRLRVPLVVDAPLWRELLAELPLPSLESDGGGQARWDGWSAAQPRARLESLAPSLRIAGAPPAPFLERRLSAPVLSWVVVFAAVTGLAWARFGRRRAGAVRLSAVRLSIGGVDGAPGGGSGSALATGSLVVFGVVGSAGGLALQRSFSTADVAEAGSGAIATRVLEADRGAALALHVATARGALAEVEAFPPDGLASFPSSAALEISLGVDGEVRAIAAAPDVVLTARRVVRELGLEGIRRGENAYRSFSAVWLRDGAGGWQSLGAWRLGEPLPDSQLGMEAVDEEGPETLPGWLAAGLPPGRDVLVGRLEDGSWLRLRGF